MDSQFIEIIAGFGPLGIAAAAIFWIFIKTSKRLDDLTDNFQAQLREQAQGHIDREAALRDRYDQVISTYNDERLEVIKGIGSKLDTIEKELEDVEGNLKIILEILANEQR
tara:strand:+ start:3135 stop:3467 length:333 start_codon:yes stop_codon:yes gene_type:complete